MMEDNKTGDASDRDRKMMGQFESYADKSDDDKDKKKEKDSKKKSKKEAKAGFLEQSKDDKKAEKNEREDKANRKEIAEAVKVEELSEDESKKIVEDYAVARTEDLKEDLAEAEPDSVEEAVALANAALLETIQENEASTEEELDAALAETIEDLELDTEAEEQAEDEEDQPAATTTTTPALPVSPVPPMPSPAMPPTPPAPPGPGPGPRPPLPPIGPSSPNVLAAPAATTADIWRPNRRRAGQLLLVGAVGYLIGRRRGRIKAEERLLPVQEKLENEVKSLHDKVAEREAKIRKLAAEKVIAQPEVSRPALIEKIESRLERKKATVAEQAAVEPEAEAAMPRPETPLVRPEALGKFALPGAELIRESEPKRETEPLPRSTETMTMPELIGVADKIEKNNISVKEMYENGRLDALGLRRVVQEYLRGNNIDRILSENLRPIETIERLPNNPAASQSPVAQSSGAMAYPSLPADHPLNAQYAKPAIPTSQSYQTGQSPPNLLAQNQTAIVAGVAAALIILLLIAILA